MCIIESCSRAEQRSENEIFRFTFGNASVNRYYPLPHCWAAVKAFEADMHELMGAPNLRTWELVQGSSFVTQIKNHFICPQFV